MLVSHHSSHPIVQQQDDLPFHTQLKTLIQEFFDHDVLTQHLEALPKQFEQPTTRPWQKIQWHTIHRSQIIGISPDIFLSILLGATETEAPIQGYAHTSHAYLEPIHQPMATYAGGCLDEHKDQWTPGLWEREERQHTPALLRVYRQLTGEDAVLKGRTVRSYQPSQAPEADLYRHGLHRIATEYSAACLYLWMMTHSTGALREVLSEILQDEVHHMANFWGFGLWLYPETHLTRTLHILKVVTAPSGSSNAHRLTHTLKRMMGVLDWDAWSLTHRLELSWTFIYVLWQLHHWSDRLSPSQLNQLFGKSPIQQ